MKAIRYQGRLWIQATKVHTIEQPVLNVDDLKAELKLERKIHADILETELFERDKEIKRLEETLEMYKNEAVEIGIPLKFPPDGTNKEQALKGKND